MAKKSSLKIHINKFNQLNFNQKLSNLEVKYRKTSNDEQKASVKIGYIRHEEVEEPHENDVDNLEEQRHPDENNPKKCEDGRLRQQIR